MAAVTVFDFIDLLARLHLADDSQIEDAKNRSKVASDSKRLARELCERGWLTSYQADLLLDGRGDELLLGSYVLLDKLGEGGMGAVFRARNWKLGRIAAIKLIRKECLASPDAVRRFYREIRAASQLEHVNIVRALDADEANGRHYLAMEFVDGIDLARLVREHGPLPPGLACEYIRQAALGLQHAHERGLVHRDIKPANLLLARDKGAGTIKVLDMGLARQDAGSDQSGTITQVGMLMGTPDYMAPEQAVSSHTVDSRADLYSLGCSLYFLLTGSVPFPGGSLTQKLLKHQMEQPRPIEMLRPDTPTSVADIAYKLMAKQREERFQTPAELAAALAAIVHDSSGQALRLAAPGKRTATVTDSPTDPFWQNIVAQASSIASSPLAKNRRRALIGSAVAASVLLVVALIVVLWPRVPPPPPPPPPPPGETPIGYALEFDGVSAHVAVPDFKYQGDHPLTVECWAIPRWVDVERDVDLFCNQTDGLRLGISKGNWHFQVVADDGPIDVVGNQADAGRRVHVAGVMDGKELRLYVDGKLAGRSDWKGPHKAGSLPFLIGANPVASGGVRSGFPGIIDEIHISRSARYKADFTPLKRLAPDRSTILLYHFDEGHDTIALNARGNEYHGTINGAIWVRGDAKPSAAPAPPLGADFAATGSWQRAFSKEEGDLKASWVTPGKSATFAWEQRDGEALLKASGSGHVSIRGSSPQWKSFHLRFDYRFPTPQRSGLKGAFFVNSDTDYIVYYLRDDGTALLTTNSKGNAWADVAEIRGGAVGATSNIPALDLRKHVPLERAQNPAGEWNTFELLCVGAAAVQRLNGKNVGIFANCRQKQPDGSFVLCNSGGLMLGVELGDVEFRRLEIRDTTALPATMVQDSEWRPLFNGKNLDGWKTHPLQPGNWKVENGLLVGRDGRSYLYSLRNDYRDFHFRVKAKINAPGNSGMHFRVAFPTVAKDLHTPAGYEVQIAGPLGDKNATGSLFCFPRQEWALFKQKEVMVKADTWFTQEVIAQGKRLMVRLNGKTLADILDEDGPPAGSLALQVYQPQTVVYFETVEIKELPFVILPRDKRTEQWYPTLAACVTAAQSGDTIEIRGNGPFETEPIDLEKRAMIIRAGPECRPVVRLSQQSIKDALPDLPWEKSLSLLRTDAALVLEGLQLEVLEPVDAAPKQIVAVHSFGSSLHLANCLIVMSRQGPKTISASVIRAWDPTLVSLKNCALHGETAHMKAVTVWPRTDTPFQVLLDNCTITGQLGVQLYGGRTNRFKSLDLAIRQSSLWTDYPLQVMHFPTNLEGEKQIRTTSQHNVVGGGIQYTQRKPAKPVADALPELLKLLKWQEQRNLMFVLDPKEGGLVRIRDEQHRLLPDQPKSSSLEDWNQIWGLGATGTILGVPQFVSEDFPSKARNSAATLTPADFRLAKGSPGQGVLPGGKDLGADVDLVGPGEAYERWKQTPAYQEWRKQTDELFLVRRTAIAPTNTLRRSRLFVDSSSFDNRAGAWHH